MASTEATMGVLKDRQAIRAVVQKMNGKRYWIDKQGKVTVFGKRPDSQEECWFVAGTVADLVSQFRSGKQQP
jgi:hypothetical protein